MRRVAWLVVGSLAAAVAGGAALAAPGLKVDDDPYKPYLVAQIEHPVGEAGACRGGVISLMAVKGRAAGEVEYGLTVRIDRLRSPGRILAVDLKGGLPLDSTGRAAGGYSCYRASCRNNAIETFRLPDATRAAIKREGRVSVRVTTSTAECVVMDEFTAEELTTLEAWGAPSEKAPL